MTAPPTTLNRRLLEGSLDVSPISSIEYAQHADSLVLLADLCIASNGPVASVLLVSRVHPSELHGRVVELDPSSATSRVLVKLVLWDRYRVEPRFEVRDHSGLEGVRGDAALVIGDPALRARLDPDGWHIEDLGEAWKSVTGRSMVYAVWAARRAFAEQHPDALESVHLALVEARDLGLANPAALAERGVALSGHPLRFLRAYYRLLGYDLGAAEREGLREFYRRAEAHHLLPASPELAFAGG